MNDNEFTYPPILEESDYMKITPEGWHSLHRMLWDWMARRSYKETISGNQRIVFPMKVHWPGWEHIKFEPSNWCFACMYAFNRLCDRLNIDAMSDGLYPISSDDKNHYCDFCPFTWNENAEHDQIRFDCENDINSLYYDYLDLQAIADGMQIKTEDDIAEVREICAKIRDKEWKFQHTVKDPPKDSVQNSL